MTVAAIMLQYKRLRAPQRDGHTLQSPPLSEFSSVWERNIKRLARHSFDLCGHSISDLRSEAQSELIQIALHHTRQYQDAHIGSGLNQVILAGHQPELFHPGVWYKNFALSALAKKAPAVGINLVIDNDLCAGTHIRVPTGSIQQPRITSIAYDSADAFVPHEMRRLQDRRLWCRFGRRVADAIKPFVDSPLIETLWPQVQESADAGLSPGLAIAAGRHKLESQIGLCTLEAPLSAVCSTSSFCIFAANLIQRCSEFSEIHNQALAEYRSLYRVRSNSHPVPALATIEQWIETPFWVWRLSDPARRRLFVKVDATQVRLSDGSELEIALEKSGLSEQLQELSSRGVYIRPRALTNTMYARLVLSQLFLHGIGGAKYDQLTDLIISRFFGVEPPEFFTLTSTNLLPVTIPNVEPRDLTTNAVRLRQLRYHPELFSDPGDVAAMQLAQEKRNLIKAVPPRGQRSSWHGQIEHVNSALQPHVEATRRELHQRNKELANQLSTRRVIGSREFSFCLFPEALSTQLKQAAS